MLEAKASAKLELARHETRAAEALAAKDAQLMRFRGELDSLLTWTASCRRGQEWSSSGRLRKPAAQDHAVWARKRSYLRRGCC